MPVVLAWVEWLLQVLASHRAVLACAQFLQREGFAQEDIEPVVVQVPLVGGRWGW